MARATKAVLPTQVSVSRTKKQEDESSKTVSRTASKPVPKAAPKLDFSATGFRNRLHAWYRENARDLPWRGIDRPYATWLSEIMLQQTRVATVLDRYSEFLERFPTLRDLAEAEENEVLALWSGLGYYRRARLLHRGAQFVVRELGGKLPPTATQLRTLPGVGDYTAAAIASIAFGESVAVLDGNVERVLLRVLGLPQARSAAARTELIHAAQALIPPAARKSPAGRRLNAPGEHNQAMMELGATVCLPRTPLCLQCPVVDLCKTRGEHVKPSRAAQQSSTVAHLLVLRKRGIATEVLLARRSQTATQMPGMLELPPLPIESVADREPVLRLRHAITNTNYYVQIFAESAPDMAPPVDEELDPDLMPSHAASPPLPSSRKTPEKASREDVAFDDDAVFVAGPAELAALRSSQLSLLQELTVPHSDLLWVSTSLLLHHPLTGLARKSLQRLRVMPMPKLRIG